MAFQLDNLSTMSNLSHHYENIEKNYDEMINIEQNYEEIKKYFLMTI